MTRLVLPWPPTVNTYWRSVAGRVLISRKGREYRLAVQRRAGGLRAPEGRLAVTIHAHPPDRRKRDLDNLFKSVLDSIQHAGVIEDDGLIDDLRIVREQRIAEGRLVILITERPQPHGAGLQREAPPAPAAENRKA